jgi:hypothetical protein
MMSYRQISGLAIAMAFAVSACSKEEEHEGPGPFKVASYPNATTSAPSAPSATSAPSANSAASSVSIKVYKTPTCGCCKAWVGHLEEAGFKVEVVDMPDLSAVKTKYGVKPELQACHTAVVGNYTIEGHVPADLIVKMLNEKPAIAGLAVPGMPSGSPGMEGGMKESYDVLSFDKTGHTSVYAHR